MRLGAVTPGPTHAEAATLGQAASSTWVSVFPGVSPPLECCPVHADPLQWSCSSWQIKGEMSSIPLSLSK